LKKNLRQLQTAMRLRQYRGPSTTRSAARPSANPSSSLSLRLSAAFSARAQCEEAQSILRDAGEHLANVIKEGAQRQEYCSPSSINRENGPRIYSDEKVIITLNHQGQNCTLILTADEAEKHDLMKVIPREITRQHDEALPPYMGLSEVAEYLGTTPQYLSGKVSKRRDFPKPISVLKCGPIWRTEEIIEYWKEKSPK
jgi:hypothetical protein